MKRPLIFTLSLTALLSTMSIQAAELTVIIDGIKSDLGGTVRVGVYSPKEEFLSLKPLRGQALKADKTKKVFVFKNLPKGLYAVTSFHDVNGNKDLDTGLFGIPTEPYGVSGQSQWGKPEFKPASFEIKDDKISVTIRYH